MIVLSKFPRFTINLKTLKELSKDNSDEGKAYYMTESSLLAVDFDAVKDAYCRDLHLSGSPNSNDALMDEGNGSFVFVEFKNGSIDGKTKYNIIKKIYDSVIILSDITSIQIKDIRKNIKYILVYNDENNKENSDTVLHKKRDIQYSKSLNNLEKNLGKLAKEEFICFGLGSMKKYLFNEIHTYTKEEFEDYLTRLK